jgi:hypothetical protein
VESIVWWKLIVLYFTFIIYFSSMVHWASFCSILQSVFASRFSYFSYLFPKYHQPIGWDPPPPPGLVEEGV